MQNQKPYLQFPAQIWNLNVSCSDWQRACELSYTVKGQICSWEKAAEGTTEKNDEPQAEEQVVCGTVQETVVWRQLSLLFVMATYVLVWGATGQRERNQQTSVVVCNESGPSTR